GHPGGLSARCRRRYEGYRGRAAALCMGADGARSAVASGVRDDVAPGDAGTERRTAGSPGRRGLCRGALIPHGAEGPARSVLLAGERGDDVPVLAVGQEAAVLVAHGAVDDLEAAEHRVDLLDRQGGDVGTVGP